jgi:tRNA pseudouridine55 synthase
VGEQEQVAPLFSAKSVDGVRAYELARKLYRSGRSAELDAAALDTLHRNKINITELELLDFFPEGTGVSKSMATLGHVRGRGPQEHLEESDAWEGSRSDDLETPVPAGKSSASSRIHVADTAGMGLPEAVIRIACSKGTYIRAFARDLGEALGSGAHLGGLIRSRSGDYTIKDALQVEDALDLLAP